MIREEWPIPCVVYALYSTRDGEHRYVGQTTNEPESRRRNIIYGAKKWKTGAIYDWVRTELLLGHKILIEIIEEFGELNITEREVIADYRQRGVPLLNVSPGGGTGKRGPARPMAPETKAKLSAAAKGRRHTAEARAKMSRKHREKRAVKNRQDASPLHWGRGGHSQNPEKHSERW